MSGSRADLYEIRMALSCLRREMCAPATFSLFVRTCRLPGIPGGRWTGGQPGVPRGLPLHRRGARVPRPGHRCGRRTAARLAVHRIGPGGPRRQGGVRDRAAAGGDRSTAAGPAGRDRVAEPGDVPDLGGVESRAAGSPQRDARWSTSPPAARMVTKPRWQWHVRPPSPASPAPVVSPPPPGTGSHPPERWRTPTSRRSRTNRRRSRRSPRTSPVRPCSWSTPTTACEEWTERSKWPACCLPPSRSVCAWTRVTCGRCPGRPGNDSTRQA
ncbi:hypothetical protein DFR72_10151 [Lentzea flaviverrucosa]|uniref:Uncharacterized protein n=1 Tax=Lentzea flaviverrucosa TaxID=200379 RepID=A0A1H9XWG9_9PSEU|nr:hypothetical protein DFR72_10151 [Lentzea flaviverrucosa]SES50525.1 hypothetical protein SAMN05216195_120156 [Lentzea flaviverrucosa]